MVATLILAFSMSNGSKDISAFSLIDSLTGTWFQKTKAIHEGS